MKFKVTAQLSYEAKSAGTLVLNVHALRTPGQEILSETFSIEPMLESVELGSVYNQNRFIRLDLPEGVHVNILYEAVVDRNVIIQDIGNLTDSSVSTYGEYILSYLNPSRYCQSDKLYRLAENTFGNAGTNVEKVFAITDWIHDNVEYLSGSTNAQTSAFDTVTEQAGVCRDFAHLGIALCRALSIPARYFTGYAYQLQPPDFHACFEAYLGGEWCVFDATRLAPLNGLVKIANGRDAADTAIASIFGDISCTYIQAGCKLANNEDFEPFFYNDNSSGMILL